MVVDGVDFVDEDDVWCMFFGLVEYVVDMGSVYVDEYFDEVGIGNGEEWYFGFVGDGFGQQGFVGVGWVDYQYVVWDMVVQVLEFVWIVKEFDQFVDFFFGFVVVGDVSEGGFDLVFGQQVCFVFVEVYWVVVIVVVILYLVYEEYEDGDDYQDWEVGDQ